ncbi:lipocalin/fatty acid-binding family protein [Lactobacillus johnsonii]|uniref:DUF3642 domain-containing protein n=1 Tax=Lactobacillus johnsonii TaxID=33959 RepID=A0A9X6P144_LACJH|nr:lipocalin/fatty acid-binding family protein [Lactobacillus johnsonii]OYS04193.1 hypothetical protein CBF54_04590 [Lactobacillus johnsonii]OYS04755.1 hypothetical protein CBF62_09505 [Lactobacillus johnsonii]OYS09040.1 hypothetical protein CBF65_04560 [Lactobacillus johnsonii]OYS10189.1 hypothetical protein CBF63_03395 [Lactobacillus johnsonii]OYS13562.1 hypothetical protein CBF48_04175 [Lactobacillus johnsonii]
MKKIIIGCLMLGTIAFTLTACQSQAMTGKDKTSQVKISKRDKGKTAYAIVGSYVDNKDKAALVLNSDHTGRYVYVDPKNPDTDDQLTWKKIDATTYRIKLNDSDVTSDLTAKVENNELNLSGDDNWNTENFKKSSKKINLDDFLAQRGQSKGQESESNSTSKESNDSTSSSIPGDDGLFNMPSELLGTWYVADYIDGSVNEVTIKKNVISGEDSGEHFTQKLHKMKKDFDLTSYVQGHSSYHDVTKDWARVVVLSENGERKINVRAWLQGAGDGEYYNLATEHGQTVLVEGGGAEAWVDGIGWRSRADAEKYAKEKFNDLHYREDMTSGDNEDE